MEKDVKHFKYLADTINSLKEASSYIDAFSCNILIKVQPTLSENENFPDEVCIEISPELNQAFKSYLDNVLLKEYQEEFKAMLD